MRSSKYKEEAGRWAVGRRLGLGDWRHLEIGDLEILGGEGGTWTSLLLFCSVCVGSYWCTEYVRLNRSIPPSGLCGFSGFRYRLLSTIIDRSGLILC